MYEIRRQLGYSTTMIGRMFGGRDHSTVVNALQRMNERFKGGPAKPVDPVADSVLGKLALGKRPHTISRELGLSPMHVRTMLKGFEVAA